ncbi:type II secretion system protein GspM [Arenimonas caeni]|jgi:general secretion pathway protein M|uniref:General secretion pathway protein GspM n=1 Tax=Arenimonas caeni TaxID=2058085 RepID=A0A2P6MC11_9GAMM|nr:type II secretion system protein GspM [Arenimonas caeni]MDY0022077.1 type II secretion system protein GspM [Arenimonas caeni]PRH83540.1 general secretion pathway protein GspM [Arenimonas caeni]
MKPALERARWLLLGLAALALAYLVLVHWWFTAPMLAMGDEIQRLRDEQLALRMEIAQRPLLERELARVREFEAGNAGFLPEGNRQLATAALVQRLESVVEAASPQPGRCQITARTPNEGRIDEPFVRATVQVRLRCGMTELGAVLHALESDSPQLFIDNLDLLSRTAYLGTGREGGMMDVSFDLYGYLATPSGVPGA